MNDVMIEYQIMFLPIKYFAFQQDTCTLTFNADNTNFKDDGWYAVALTIEDFPKAPITIDNTTYNETTPITQVPLQVNQAIV